jgi:hypothetical protein
MSSPAPIPPAERITPSRPTCTTIRAISPRVSTLSRDTTLAYDADSRPLSVTLPNPDGGGSGGPSESVVYDAVG